MNPDTARRSHNLGLRRRKTKKPSSTSIISWRQLFLRMAFLGKRKPPLNVADFNILDDPSQFGKALLSVRARSDLRGKRHRDPVERRME